MNIDKLLKPITRVLSADEARLIAIDYQNWASEQSLSYAEVSQHSGYFFHLGEKFGLTDEFAENGII